MLIFIVNKINEIDFIDETKFQDIFNLSNNFYIWKSIHWWILNISKEEFIKNIPLLNWFVNKYGFINEVILPIKEELIKLQNVYEIEFDNKKIENIPNIVWEIKNFIEANKLLTNSKKEKFSQKLDDAIYLILQNIVKLYFIIYDTVKNKEDLKNIMQSNNILEEYKAQANLLEYTSSTNIEKMVNQINFLISQLDTVAIFFYKFKKEYKLI